MLWPLRSGLAALNTRLSQRWHTRRKSGREANSLPGGQRGHRTEHNCPRMCECSTSARRASNRVSSGGQASSDRGTRSAGPRVRAGGPSPSKPKVASNPHKVATIAACSRLRPKTMQTSEATHRQAIREAKQEGIMVRTVIPRQKKRGPNGGVSLRCGHGKAKQKRKEKKEPMKIGKRKKSREKKSGVSRCLPLCKTQNG